MSKATIFAWARPLAGLALVLLLSPISPARAQDGASVQDNSWQKAQQVASNQKLRIHISADQGHCLRVAAAGVRTRNDGTPTASGIVTLPAVVTPGSVVWAGLYWDILADAPPGNAVTLNGAAVVPVALPITFSPCWQETFAYAYFADVTALVVPGPNTVAGLDDSGMLGVGPESEGVSLVVIYRSLDASACEIIVTDGNDLRTSFAQIDNPLPVTCLDQPAILTFLGGDGQTEYTGDNDAWNSVALGDGDDWDSSDPAMPGSAPLGWDTDSWGVATAPPNVASISGTPNDAADCVNWLATVLEVGGKPDVCAVPAGKSTWGRIKSQYR